MATLEPISYAYSLRASAAEAFAVYTGDIARWWDPRYTTNADTLESVTIEPRVGGRVYATHRDLGRHDWGEVTVWEPGRRIVHTFTLAQDPAHPSEVSASFAPDDDGCTLWFEHGGWTEASAEARARFGDWPALLGRFAALAEGRA